MQIVVRFFGASISRKRSCGACNLSVRNLFVWADPSSYWVGVSFGSVFDCSICRRAGNPARADGSLALPITRWNAGLRSVVYWVCILAVVGWKPLANGHSGCFGLAISRHVGH